MICVHRMSAFHRSRSLPEPERYLEDLEQSAVRKDSKYLWFNEDMFDRLREKWSGGTVTAGAVKETRPGWLSYVKAVEASGSDELKRALADVRARIGRLGCPCNGESLRQRFMEQNPVDRIPLHRPPAIPEDPADSPPSPAVVPTLWEAVRRAGKNSRNGFVSDNPVSPLARPPVFYVLPSCCTGMIGKVASTSIAAAVCRDFHPDIFETMKQIPGMAHKAAPRTRYPELPVRLLIRDPVRRFISAAGQMARFTVDGIIKGLRGGNPFFTENFHLLPQTLYTLFGGFLYRFPEHIRHFEKDCGLGELPILNPRVTGVTLTAEQEAFVLDYYADDVRLYSGIREPGQTIGETQEKKHG